MGQQARAVLRKVAAGELPEAEALALARAVLSRDDVRLALQVVEGGEHRTMRAVELAALLLTGAGGTRAGHAK